jgi:hypothetical protein
MATSTSAAKKEVARREAKGRFRKIRREAIRLKLTCVGDPTLVAKSLIEVRGIGDRLSGTYYIESIKHSVSTSGYTMVLTVRRDGPARPREQATVDESTVAPVNELRAAIREQITNQLTPTEVSAPDQVGGKATQYNNMGGRGVDVGY